MVGQFGGRMISALRQWWRVWTAFDPARELRRLNGRTGNAWQGLRRW